MAQAHRRRMAELDAIRRLLESRAGEVEAAHTSLERERSRLRAEYEGKVGELTEARARLERQVAKMEGKEAQLRGEWGRFEEEKAAAVAEAEVRWDNRGRACVVFRRMNDAELPLCCPRWLIPNGTQCIAAAPRGARPGVACLAHPSIT
jgi:hypothetical protein